MANVYIEARPKGRTEGSHVDGYVAEDHADHVRRPVKAREREIVTLVRAGLANKAIAFRLGVSEGTVKSHLNQVYRKLGVRNRVALIIYSD